MSAQSFYFYALSMFRNKIIFGLTVLLFSASGMRAQYAWDIGVSAGAANYLGEIGGGPGLARDWILDMKLDQTRWNPGAFVRYRADYNFGVTLSLEYLRLQGADSLTENPNRFTRNLSFRNDVFELGLTGEYYFFNQPDVGRTGRYLLDFKAYFFGGVSVFYNNPKAQLNGEWLALRPLNTEGLETPYSQIQAAIPLGFGFFYTFSRLHRYGLKVSYRYTFTDYIDDVSTLYPDAALLESPEAVALSNRTGEIANHPLAQGLAEVYVPGQIRGNPDANDSFLTIGVNYSYVIRGKSKSFGKRRNYLYGRKRGRMGRARF